MKKNFKTNPFNSKVSLGLLFFRLVLGTAFLFHGRSKIQNPMGWMGESGPPRVFQLLAAVSEFGGGLSLILGLLIPLSSFGLFCTMAVAVHMHAVVRGDPFVGQKGAYEPALVYLAAAVMFFLVGPGRYSLDQKIFGTKS